MVSLSNQPQISQVTERLFSNSSVVTASETSTKTLVKSTAPIKTQFTKAEFGEKWPFTVDQGEVDCVLLPNYDSLGAAIFRTSTGVYALNETALAIGEASNYKHVGEIWKDHPKLTGTKMSILTIIQASSQVCRQKTEKANSHE
ncbi:DUF2511 domain-containing protein [Lyngbya aestuarii]|uniref:DUF2511 domain-containing protein n=1 Tax=Lyngbya aestuarii TaxID=118322 RepID=UPI00403DDBBC